MRPVLAASSPAAETIQPLADVGHYQQLRKAGSYPADVICALADGHPALTPEMRAQSDAGSEGSCYCRRCDVNTQVCTDVHPLFTSQCNVAAGQRQREVLSSVEVAVLLPTSSSSTFWLGSYQVLYSGH